MYPSSSVTDAQWAILEPLLPPPGNTRGHGGRPEKHCRRTVLDAIFYVVRGGIAWRQLPSDFPPATTVYAIFTRWVASRAWRRIHDALRDQLRVGDGRSPLPTAAVIDSQSVKGADTVHGPTRGFDAGKKINGRKRHIAVDTGGLLLAIVVTAASIQDRDGALRLVTTLRAAFSTITLLWADGGYSGRMVAWSKSVLSLTVQIVKRSDDTTGFTVLPRRWVVERTLGWISRHRRCVRDYETRPDHHETMIHIAMIAVMSRRLARR
ncbi:IS5 family transposase [Nocardia sp. SYP-A9097]|uniref:IS5 family transposase n=1 Tax=Nocardia sp. SYP-A9097 TaxID=2663237 RepID=UPI00132AF233|nr:IS5 family transposase [Nocardia sp. SYP-A9097]MRH93642.1 IS5 family transposase [Nocardia sp. SYP-A9097]